MVLFALHLAQTISSRTAFQVSCFLFPFTPLHFHHFRAPSLPRRLTHARIWTPPFDASCQWVCCSALHLKSDSNHPLIRCTSPLKCAPPGILPKQHRAKKIKQSPHCLDMCWIIPARCSMIRKLSLCSCPCSGFTLSTKMLNTASLVPSHVNFQ